MATTSPTNPFVTSNFAGSFTVYTDGDVQGTYYDDPAARWALAGGILSQSETLPMWGGVGLYLQVPTPGVANPNNSLGPIVGRATTLTATSATGLTGFSVFSQAYGMIIDPGASNVPLAASGMQVMFFPLGSRARVAVACDPALASLEGGSIGQQVSWDFNNQRLQPYDASTATVSVSSAAWATNVYTLTVVTANLIWTPVAGDYINVSGATNTGTGGAGVVNGNFQVLSTSVSGSNTLINLSLPAGSGVVGTIAGTIVMNFGTGALNVQVLRVSTGNSMIVSWNPTVAQANWNPTGATAVIQI
jgi:hypothetical protein